MWALERGREKTDGISAVTAQGTNAGTLESGEHESGGGGGRQRFGCGGTLVGDEIAAAWARGEEAVGRQDGDERRERRDSQRFVEHFVEDGELGAPVVEDLLERL